MDKPKTVEEYIASKPAEVRDKLQELREIVKQAIPHAKEDLRWGAPAMIDPETGMIYVVFSAFKDHMNFVTTPSARQAFDAELEEYKTGKGSVQLQYDKPLPKDLIQKIAKYRVDEYKNHGVKWM